MADFETTLRLSRHAMECPFCGGIDLHLIDMGTTFWTTAAGATPMVLPRTPLNRRWNIGTGPSISTATKA